MKDQKNTITIKNLTINIINKTPKTPDVNNRSSRSLDSIGQITDRVTSAILDRLRTSEINLDNGASKSQRESS